MANQVMFKDTKLSIGDILHINQKFIESGKERIQVFEGRLIAIKGRTPNKTITVRRIGADNIGVEKIFPIESPMIEKIEVKKSIPEKRAKLYYLRQK